MNKSKAPDTRGKLESVKVPKAKKKKAAKKKSFKEFAKEHTPQAIKTKITSKKTKGQIFKETHGYSKSLKRAMRRVSLDPMVYSDSLNEYRAIRKKRKQVAKKKRQDKHSLARANRIAKRATSKKK